MSSSTDLPMDDVADIEALLDAMTLQEKAAQLAGTYVGTMDDTRTVAEAEGMVRNHGIGFVTPFGYGASPHRDPDRIAEIVNRLQRAAIEETRLGIPILIPVDAIHGHAYVEEATVFPHNLGLAATRDPDLTERVGATTATEVAATGAGLVYGPTCDVARDPRWGRTFESFGESPQLCATLAAAKARGVHEAPAAVATMAKHFPAYGEPDRGEDAAPVDRSLSSLRRDFVRPFEAVIDTGVAGVMPSYNSINGEPAHSASYWLTDILREEFGFDGYVASDWGGISMLHENHRVAESQREAIQLALTAGVDVHSLGETDHIDHLVALVESGSLSMSAVDTSVRRVLRLKAELGLFAEPYVDATRTRAILGSDTNQQVALEAARKSMTLVKNDADLLPFDPDVGEILVTGPNADALSHQIGGWSVKDDVRLDGTTIRDGIESVVGTETTVTYERGCEIDAPGAIEAATEAATEADVAVVALGENWYLHEFGPSDTNGPTTDFPNRAQLSLPEPQQDLLRAVVATGTPTALVMISGRPLAIPWAAENVPAILQAYYPGADGGMAVAETIFGRVNPSGRLPISVPRSTGHLPTRHDHLPNPYPLGPDEHLPSYDPLWPFGHGLSYSAFEYRALTLSVERLGPGASVTASVELENTSDRAGDAVFDLFASREYSSVVTPERELVGSGRVHLEANERATVDIEIPASAFDVFYPDGRRELEPGTVTVQCESLEVSLEIGT